MLDGLNLDAFTVWLQSLGTWAIAASLILNIVISVAGVIPSIWLTGANVIAFGPELGFAVSLIGETLGAVSALILYRRGLSNIPAIKQQRWAWLQRLHQYGRVTRACLVLVARFIPLVPSGVVNAIAALSTMSMLDFTLMTIIGKAPSIWIEGVLGKAMYSNSTIFHIALIMVVIALIVGWIRRKPS
ncbi:VTT domain-containing protein [Paenibacillus sp. SC116]|uniref:TVP38/TMEM64 family protein n=1 Tax=Paenibacillus sp. SC116 TaxID=2968986 RepID=UPI00215A2B42|nr:VTT domain-containing protein [Paenibacillus sp. SC116]MCR8845560.1 VTT domain-containing protein [Paenibacillus sp. SC116]